MITEVIGWRHTRISSLTSSLPPTSIGFLPVESQNSTSAPRLSRYSTHRLQPPALARCKGVAFFRFSAFTLALKSFNSIDTISGIPCQEAIAKRPSPACSRFNDTQSEVTYLQKLKTQCNSIRISYVPSQPRFQQVSDFLQAVILICLFPPSV